MTETRFLIWSIEHSAWWKPNSRGYTPNRKDAGRYSWEEATAIVKGANMGRAKAPNEALVPEEEEERDAENQD